MCCASAFYPTALKAGKVCPACISETVRCRKLILGRGHWLGGVGVHHSF